MQTKHHLTFTCRPKDDQKIKTASHNVAESLIKPQEDLPLDSAVTQANTRLSYDVFISYSHQNKTHADKLLETLSSVDPDLKIFIDTAGLNTGTSWQQLLYNALGTVTGEQGWHSGESARLPPMWPGFNSRTLRHVG